MSQSHTSASPYVVQSVITLVLLGWIMIKRFQPRALDGDTRRRVMPFVYIVIGLVLMVEAAKSAQSPGSHQTHTKFGGADVAYLVLLAAVSLVVGAFRGTTLKLWVENGTVMRVYRPVTAAIWIGLIILRIIAAHVGVGMGVSEWLASASDLFFFGISSLGELLVLLARARTAGPDRGGFRRFAE